MNAQDSTLERVDTVVIGAGQAGLSVGYHLAKRGRSFVILDNYDRVGDTWRERYDSLRLYSPAKYDGLPGLPFPAKPYHFPSGAEMADYLETYAAHFGLPVIGGVTVNGVAADGGQYLVSSATRSFQAANVVVASGSKHIPFTPEFARELDPGIRQLHANDYRNPSQLLPGDVLVVGAAHSGADIALEVSGEHRTVLSGRATGQAPFKIEGRPARVFMRGLWFAANHVLTVRTPIGRKVRPVIRSHGGPLLRVKAADLADAGVEWIKERTAGVQDGMPVLDGGRVLDVRNVIWCTGYRHDLDWINLPIIGDDGWPKQTDGVADDHPGLYFNGLIFQSAFASMLVGGAGRDAAHIVEHIAARAAVSTPAPVG